MFAVSVHLHKTGVMVKVKLPLGLINSALNREDVWGSGCIAPPFLTSLLDGVQW
jgi:hypothetical protein